MIGLSTFGSDEDTFDEEGTFVPAHIPEPGPFLASHGVLTGEDHVSFHQETTTLFEERGVYDMTFGYNLTKLNRDTRHPDAGFRYAEDADEQGVLRAEFTPTTEFCPQGDTLVKGAFRAWNELRERHEYDLVRVRVAEMHQQAEAINADLVEMEQEFRETGTIEGQTTVDASPDTIAGGSAVPMRPEGEDSDAPF